VRDVPIKTPSIAVEQCTRPSAQTFFLNNRHKSYKSALMDPLKRPSGNKNGHNWTSEERNKAEKLVPFPIKFQLIHERIKMRKICPFRISQFIIHHHSFPGEEKQNGERASEPNILPWLFLLPLFPAAPIMPLYWCKRESRTFSDEALR
jgi:hypothetical protein